MLYNQTPGAQTWHYRSLRLPKIPKRQRSKVTPRGRTRADQRNLTRTSKQHHRKSGSRQPAPIPPILPRFIYSEYVLRMHNDGQVLLIFIECRAQLFEVDAELGVEKGPEEAQLFY